MRLSGYSTGAVALSDFRKALELLATTSANAVELSALRSDELAPLIAALESLDLSKYSHVSVHAPSKFDAADESRIVDALMHVAKREWFVVAHPDSFHDISKWAVLGEWLCIENMDKRKPIGRTASELADVFASLPKARMCFDIAHARQCDGSMTEAYRILQAFAGKIVQVHISEVDTDSRHTRMSNAAAEDYCDVAAFIPANAAAIVESQVCAGELEAELIRSRQVLASSFENCAF